MNKYILQSRRSSLAACKIDDYINELHTDLIFWVTTTITNSWTAALSIKVMNIALVLDSL